MSQRRDPNPRLKGFARRMRAEPTDAERKFWFILRDRKLGGFKFRRQHPIAGYIADFFCMEANLVVESDGGQHYDPDGLEYDARRTRALADQGVRVMRFGDHDVLKHPDAVARTIFNTLTERPSPLPSPGVPGEGEESSPSPQPSPGVPGEGGRPPSSGRF